LDGNLLSDGRWSYGWDAESRLTNMTSLSGPVASLLKLDFTYDYQGRRIQKIVSTNAGSGWVYSYTNRFVYDGWNVVAILDGGDNMLYSFTWGLDLSGSPQGAGGVGGLLSMRVYSGANAGTYFYCHDGNGNVAALVNTGNGSIAAQYEYGAFGELIRATGPMASVNPFLFSTEYRDAESGFYYYGCRYYNPTTGRWIGRDPAEEEVGGLNLYGFVGNSPLNYVDWLGLEWKVSRTGGGRATATCDCGDTVATLAAIIKLNANEYTKWLQPAAGTAMPASSSTVLPSGMQFTVPNTFVIGVGYGGIATTILARWQMQVTFVLEKRGFDVETYRYDTGSKDLDVERAARGKDVWGMALFGHGYKKIINWHNWDPDPGYDNGALAWDKDKSELIAPRTISTTNQKFGLFIAYFCYANLADWPTLVSSNGKYYGSKGSLSALSGPRGIGYWGTWDGLIRGATQ
jgi:RHS repeat-associated protein